MSPTVLEPFRRAARLLLRASRSPRVSTALPAVRRMHAAGVLAAARLADAFSRREEIRLKHALRTIAVECGVPSWEAFVADPSAADPGSLAGLRLIERPRAAFLNEWFPTEEDARKRQVERGGHVVRVGTQAVLCGDDMYGMLDPSGG